MKHWESWVVWMTIASCASPWRSHATKCLLRRQTESQRDFVHHRRLAREAALGMTTPHPQSLSPLRGEGSQWRRGQLDWMAIASCASPWRSHATKCLLRRQTGSQRDFVHHRRLAREAALEMTTPHPQSLSPLRGEGSQWRRDPHLGRFGYERNRLTNSHLHNWFLKSFQ